MTKARQINDEMFGTLNIIINELTGCWFIAKEITTALNIKLTNKDIETIVTPSNLIKIKYIHSKSEHVKNIKDILWKKQNDHTDKYLINKFGVLQLIHSIKSYNTTNITEHFITLTFKKSIISNIQQQNQQTNNNLTELDRLRLKLFSNNKFEVIEAHKAILKLENQNNEKQLQNNYKQQTDNNNINTNTKYKIEQEILYEKAIAELNKVIEENKILKNQIGRGNDWQTVAFKKREWKTKFGHTPDWKMLCKISKNMNIPPIKDVIEKDKKGTERKVNRYHKDVWEVYEDYELRKFNTKQPKPLPLN